MCLAIWEMGQQPLLQEILIRVTRPMFVPVSLHVSLVWVGYNSVVPLPAAPLRYAGPIVGIWTIAGAIVAGCLPDVRATGPGASASHDA